MGQILLSQTACLVKEALVDSPMSDSLIPLQGKPIVFTGAMVPHAVRGTDAAFNLGFALGVTKAFKGASVGGVHIAIQGEVFDPDHVAKLDAAFKKI